MTLLIIAAVLTMSLTSMAWLVGRRHATRRDQETADDPGARELYDRYLGDVEALTQVYLLQASSDEEWLARITKQFTARDRPQATEVPALGRNAGALLWLAVFITGRKRAHLSEEWRSHLLNDMSNDLSSLRKAQGALGFLLAAVRFRIGDVCDLFWWLADMILASRELSGLAVATPLVAAALLMIHYAGVNGLASNADNLVPLGSALYAALLIGRWRRGEKPPRSKPRRTKE